MAPTVAILGSGAAGLVTAHVLAKDGFEAKILTRDSTAGGTWARQRLYPGQQLNTLAELGQDGRTANGRRFAMLPAGTIEYGVEVVNVRREDEVGWTVDMRHFKTGIEETQRFDKVVLCTGGSSKPSVPVPLDSTVLHSSQFGSKVANILDKTKNGEPIVESRRKSNLCAYLASQGRNVTIVYERANTFNASDVPLPAAIRLGRFLSVISPYPNLRSRPERFLHTTWLGSKLVHGFLNFIVRQSYRAMKIPSDSTSTRTFGRTGEKLKPEVVVLATGYTSSWGDLFDEGTVASLGLDPHRITPSTDDEWASYTTLKDAPAPRRGDETLSTSIYKSIVPAKNILKRDFAINGAVMSVNDGYTFELVAHVGGSIDLGHRTPLSSRQMGL
ncbi:hypothetical protein MKEN_00382500 [Mycena kentingensis (nom. inval.)]|nr:hypothetical protein MKEN_00382500 [Mycena kentingensis (nom. inval.)]